MDGVWIQITKPKLRLSIGSEGTRGEIAGDKMGHLRLSEARTILVCKTYATMPL